MIVNARTMRLMAAFSTFYITIVVFFHFDIVRHGFELGLVGTDDSNYYYAADKFNYLESRVWIHLKNPGYYAWNFIFQAEILGLPLVKIANGVMLAVSIAAYYARYLRKDKINSIWRKHFILTLLLQPAWLVPAMNYKDSLVFSLVLLLYLTATSNIGSRSKVVFILLLITALESLRAGVSSVILVAYAASVYVSVSPTMRKRVRRLISVALIIFSAMLIFPILMELALDILGRDLASYRKNFAYREISVTGFPNVDAVIVGTVKTLFQFNIISAFRVINEGIGEHGYASNIYLSLYMVTIFSWPFILLLYTAALSRSPSCPDLFLFFYCLLNILIYSFIYGGMIGSRLVFPVIMTIILTISTEITSEKRKKSPALCSRVVRI